LFDVACGIPALRSAASDVGSQLGIHGTVDLMEAVMWKTPLERREAQLEAE
jgi:hypothetical protein